MSSEPHIYFDEVNERQAVFHRRSFLLGGFAGLGMLALGARLTQLQIVDASRYQTLSASNQFNFRLKPPPRGRILDRDGVEIASNRPEFRILLNRDGVKDKDVEGAIDRVAEIIPITPARRAQIRRDIAESRPSSPVAIATDLTWDEFSRVSVRTPELPGVSAEMDEARFYPFPGAFSHVIGYVSKVSASDLDADDDKDDPLLHHPGFRIGKAGVEKSQDLLLRGKAGGQKVEVDSVGRVVREDPAGDIRPTPGAEIVLTLDSDIQKRALEVMGTESGAAVMIDCRTGDILCLVSTPSFDANQFVTGIPGPLYKELATYERKPLLNKALTANYAPGSTFKTMVTLAALQHGYDPKTTHVCGKSWFWGGRTWHCDEAHGAQDLRGALKTSCDIYFFQCALSLGPDRMAAVARDFGLGALFDIGIPGQKQGIVPDTAYKRSHFPHDPTWHPGETPSMGIGQGYNSVNALQLAVMCARIGNGTKAIQPRLIHSIDGKLQAPAVEPAALNVQPEHMAFLHSAMTGVVTEPGGTAFKSGVCKLNLGPVVMAGKSGTAQGHNYVGGGHGVHGTHGAYELRDHAWFIAFAPADDPRYAVSVLVEHGGFGAETSAPKAREIMKVALLKDPEVRARFEHALPEEPAAAPAAAPASGADPAAPVADAGTPT
ncbi:MAG: penicillin-binding protein 2 [Caulobacteraceae bacterium]